MRCGDDEALKISIRLCSSSICYTLLLLEHCEVKDVSTIQARSAPVSLSREDLPIAASFRHTLHVTFARLN